MRYGFCLAAMVFAACGSGSPTKGDGGNAGGCAPGSLDATLFGSTVTSSCYQASTGNGLALAFMPTQSTSGWGSDGDGLYVDFSNASGCSYADGKVLQLTDPCLQIGDNGTPGGGALPGGVEPDGGTDCAASSSCPVTFLGLTNSCASDVAGVVADQGCGSASQAGTAPTTGTLTLTHWTTSPGGTISLSVSGTLTGFTLSGNSYQAVAVPFNGTAQAVVQ